MEAQIRDLLASWTRESLLSTDDAGRLFERLLELVEPPVLKTVVENNGGQVAAAARILGLHRTTLRKKLDQHGLGGDD